MALILDSLGMAVQQLEKLAKFYNYPDSIMDGMTWKGLLDKEMDKGKSFTQAYADIKDLILARGTEMNILEFENEFCKLIKRLVPHAVVSFVTPEDNGHTCTYYVGSEDPHLARIYSLWFTKYITFHKALAIIENFGCLPEREQGQRLARYFL